MDRLQDQNIVRLTGSEAPLQEAEIREYQAQIPGWQVIRVDGEDRLQKVFAFKDFTQALDFTNRIGKIAEQVDHHPALLTEWGKVTVAWWTHKIRGLHRNDLVMAAKTDHEYEKMHP